MQMTTPSDQRVVALLVGLVLLLAACGGSDEGAEASETTTTEAPGAASLNLTFDGESCTYEGPTVITAGPVELTFLNESEKFAATNFVELLEGKTIDDIIEYGEPYPTSKHAPSWTRELGTWRSVPAGESQHWEGGLEPGIYYMVCARVSPLAVWHGTGLTVEG